MADFDNHLGDDMSDYVRGRCNTWPRSQFKPPDGDDHHHEHVNYSHFSPLTPPEYSSELSLINESNESIHNSVNGDFVHWSPNNCAPASLLSSNSGVTNYKAGHPSYVELITQAILSSPEKRMTLSEIYDWMVSNVDAFKDQRQLPCSTGWKNSVRHNLSLHSRFKRVKRNGMDKPSWWTVDLSEEVKRDRRRRNLKAGARIRTTSNRESTDTFGRMSADVQNCTVGSFNTIFSSPTLISDNSFNTQLINNQHEFSRLPSQTTDPFAQQMITLNCTNAAGAASSASDTEGHLSAYDIGDNSVSFMQMDCSKQQQPQFASTPSSFFDIQHKNSTTVNSLWPVDAHNWSGQEDTTDCVTLSQKLNNQHITLDTLDPYGGVGRRSIDGHYPTTNGHHTLTSCSFSPSGEPTNVIQSNQSMDVANNSLLSTNLCGFAEAITVNLRDANSFADCANAGRPTITLNVSADTINDVSPSHNRNHFQTTTLSGRANNFDEPRQIMRVQLANGHSQDVTIPAPVQLKIVIRSEKSCQTDDLESELRYRLRVNSASSTNNYNRSDSALYNAATPETNISSSSMIASSSASSINDQRNSNIQQQFADYRDTCIVNGQRIASDPWFHVHDDVKHDCGPRLDVTETYNDYQFVL